MTELEIATPSGARKPLPRLGNGDLGIRPFMVRIMQERYNVIAVNPSLIQSYPWPTTKPYYNLRKMLDHLGYNIDETYPPGHKLAGKVILAERRPYIQGKMLTEICEKEFGMKRHELGIFVDERTQFVYRGESQSVGFYDIDSLINKGTDFILCEKAYAVKPIAPLASPYGIVLLECGGNFVEYARMLCEKAVRRGCNVGILTDFDISGIAMCINIPWATRIGIDERTIYDLGLTEKQIKIVQERYNADPGQMKFVIETLNKYNSKKGWIDGPLDWSGEGTYNLELVKSLNLDQRRALRYLAELRIELDHVIDEAGPERFFQYLKKTMEDRFRDRDYNYTVESATVDEIRPPTAKEFVAKMDKLLLQIPALQPALTEISNEHRNDIDGLQPIDEIRQDMLDRLIETEEEDPKVKRLLPKLVKIMKELGLPELTDEEKRNL